MNLGRALEKAAAVATTTTTTTTTVVPDGKGIGGDDGSAAADDPTPSTHQNHDQENDVVMDEMEMDHHLGLITAAENMESRLPRGITLFGGFTGTAVCGDLVELDAETGETELAWTPADAALRGSDVVGRQGPGTGTGTGTGTGRDRGVGGGRGGGGGGEEKRTIITRIPHPAARFGTNAATVSDPAVAGTMMVVCMGVDAGKDLGDVWVWRYSLPESEDSQHAATDAAEALLGMVPVLKRG